MRFKKFGSRPQLTRQSLRQLLTGLKGQNKKISAYGAAAKGNTLLQYCGIGSNVIDYVTDTAPSKQGRYTPGGHIPIVDPSRLKEDLPDYVLLTAWNYADSIISRESWLLDNGIKFIKPIPEVRVIGKRSSSRPIMVTGGSGMVGSQVDFGTKPSHSKLDILDPISIRRAITKYQPGVILHLAAMTDMTACEQDPEKAYQINVIGTRNLATACREANVRLVYLSSGAVFDGQKQFPYTETDLPHPLNVYGKTKLAGEIAAREILPEVLIVRTGWLFGGGEQVDTKYVFKTIKNILQGVKILANNERYGSPTYIPDLLAEIKRLIDIGAIGVVHVVSHGYANYYDIAHRLNELLGTETNIEAVSAQAADANKAPRGRMEAMESHQVLLRPWDEAAKEYIATLNIPLPAITE